MYLLGQIPVWDNHVRFPSDVFARVREGELTEKVLQLQTDGLYSIQSARQHGDLVELKLELKLVLKSEVKS